MKLNTNPLVSIPTLVEKCNHGTEWLAREESLIANTKCVIL